MDDLGNDAVDERTVSAAEEADLARAVEAGLVAGALLTGQVSLEVDAHPEELQLLVATGERARLSLFASQLRLAHWLANQAHRRWGGSLDDLDQEAMVGLADAVLRYDHRRGARLSTHAYQWIQWRLAEGTRRQRRDLSELGVVEPAERPDPAAGPEALVVGWAPPEWFWRLPVGDQVLLLRRHGLGTSRARLAAEWGTSPASLRRMEQAALARARSLGRGAGHRGAGEWSDGVGSEGALAEVAQQAG